MFCFQCQEAAKGTGCTIKGVCGKSDDVANLQDLLVFVAKGVSTYAMIAGENNLSTKEADKFVMEALFTTITNANFDRDAVIAKIREGYAVRKITRNRLESNGVSIPADLHSCTTWESNSVGRWSKRLRSSASSLSEMKISAPSKSF